MKSFYKAIHYNFRDQVLCQQALTHRSFGGEHNERMEFLGDAVLNVLISEWLYQHFSDKSEGELTHMRSFLVCKDTLQHVAKSIRLGEFLRLGTGEVKSGGKEKPSILADSLEALIGAVYLDGGIEAIETQIQRWFVDYLEPDVVLTLIKDPKTRLQEVVQKLHKVLPTYHLLASKGVDHDKTFIVECVISVMGIKTIGRGKSRKQAEQIAANEMLVKLGEESS